MKVSSREWPPDPEAPSSKPPTYLVVTLLLAIVLFLGSPILAWFVAAVLPGEQPWAFGIWPGGWFLALLALAVTTFIHIKRGR